MSQDLKQKILCNIHKYKIPISIITVALAVNFGYFAFINFSNATASVISADSSNLVAEEGSEEAKEEKKSDVQKSNTEENKNEELEEPKEEEVEEGKEEESNETHDSAEETGSNEEMNDDDKEEENKENENTDDENDDNGNEAEDESGYDGESEDKEQNDDQDNNEYEEGNGNEEKDDSEYEKEDQKNNEMNLDQMEKDYTNWERNLKWREKDLKRAEKLEERLIKEKERFEKKSGKGNKEINFDYNDYINLEQLEEIQLKTVAIFTEYKDHLDKLKSYINLEDSEGFYNYTDTMWIFNLESNTTNICLNSLDRYSWLIDFKRYVAEYFYEVESLSLEGDMKVAQLDTDASTLISDAQSICDNLDTFIEGKQSLFDEFLSVTMDERSDMRFDLQDVESEMWDMQDELNMKFDDFETNDPWDTVDNAMQAIQFQRESEFIKQDISSMKTEITEIEEVLNKIITNDGDTSNVSIANELLTLINEAAEIISEVENAIENENQEEDVFDTLGGLEEIGWEADKLINDLNVNSLEEYLSDEEVDLLFEGGKDNQHERKFEDAGFDSNTAKTLADQVSEEDALELIKVLLQKVNINEFEELVGTLQENGDEADINSIVNMMDRVDDEETLQRYIESKKNILNYLDLLGNDSNGDTSLLSIKSLLLSYNFAGESADKVNEALEEYLASSQSTEDKEALYESLVSLKKEDVYYKMENDLISFEDVLETDWYYEAIEQLKNNGIVNGKSATSFNPADNITNAEMLKIALESTSNGENLTQNLEASHWAEQQGYVARANELGIDFDTDLDETASRGYVVYLLEQLAEITPEDYTTIGFTDVSLDHIYADYIEYARIQEWISGDSDTGNFRADDPINRAEVSKIVAKFMESIEQ